MSVSHAAPVKLSICITTFNRPTFIGETLESVLGQATDECEVVVVDASSTDDTERVVSKYAARSNHLRYVRQKKNNGFDQDCDRAVEIACGQYCWLMTDDDLLKPGAIAVVLEALRQDVSLVVVNAEVRAFDMSRVLQPRWLKIESNRLYGPGEMDRLFLETGEFLKYVGAIIIARSIWLARERRRYYGSWFVYLGVIFQEPLPTDTFVIAESLVSYRAGNIHNWSPKTVDIVFGRWPSLVASLAISEATKERLESVQPWRHIQWLLLLRGAGFYSLNEYRTWVHSRLTSIRERLARVLVAVVPGVLVNAALIVYYSIRGGRGDKVQIMRESRFYFRNWRTFSGK